MVFVLRKCNDGSRGERTSTSCEPLHGDLTSINEYGKKPDVGDWHIADLAAVRYHVGYLAHRSDHHAMPAEHVCLAILTDHLEAL
jgi:hypothetical protein